MRRSVSSPDEALRSGMKTDRVDEHRGVSSGDETQCRMLDFTSQTIINK